MTTVRNPSCLIGAGMLGHTWVATAISSETFVERIMCQASFGADAVRALDDMTLPAVISKKELPGYIYERTGRKWKRVTRAYALLDQPTDGRKPYEPAIEEGA
jgi:hypothetical protein